MSILKTASQSSRLPTRKLATGSGVAAIVTQLWIAVLGNLAAAHVEPGLVDQLLDIAAGAEVAAAVGMLVAVLVGYFVPDAPNGPPKPKAGDEDVAGARVLDDGGVVVHYRDGSVVRHGRTGQRTTLSTAPSRSGG